MDDSNLINLADFIKQIKADLTPLEEDDQPLFYIESVEIEAQVVANLEQGAKAGIGIKLLGLGADINSKRGEVSTQKIKINLSPLFNKDELLEKVSAEDKEEMKVEAVKRVMRGGSGGGRRMRGG